MASLHTEQAQQTTDSEMQMVPVADADGAERARSSSGDRTALANHVINSVSPRLKKFENAFKMAVVVIIINFIALLCMMLYFMQWDCPVESMTIMSNDFQPEEYQGSEKHLCYAYMVFDVDDDYAKWGTPALRTAAGITDFDCEDDEYGEYGAINCDDDGIVQLDDQNPNPIKRGAFMNKYDMWPCVPEGIDYWTDIGENGNCPWQDVFDDDDYFYKEEASGTICTGTTAITYVKCNSFWEALPLAQGYVIYSTMFGFLITYAIAHKCSVDSCKKAIEDAEATDFDDLVERVELLEEKTGVHSEL